MQKKSHKTLTTSPYINGINCTSQSLSPIATLCILFMDEGKDI
ncbi:hypothetical protein ECP03047778_5047, partial [Escherichia coli P0304777.8]